MSLPSKAQAVLTSRFRHVVIAFDAAGTLVRFLKPAGVQYVEEARAYGAFKGATSLADVDPDRAQAAFRAAFKAVDAKHPAYGRWTSLGHRDWWRLVIDQTFEPLLEPGTKLPKELYGSIMSRFSGNQAYELAEPDLFPLLHRLRESACSGPIAKAICRSHGGDEVPGELVAGVLTNADGRMAAVLPALGITVEPPLAPGVRATRTTTPPDLAFFVTPHNFGWAKPNRLIFDRAKYLAGRVASKRWTQNWLRGGPDWKLRSAWQPPTPPFWARCINVGDRYETDVLGALRAGWSAVLVDPDARQAEAASSSSELSSSEPSSSESSPSSPMTTTVDNPVVLAQVRAIRDPSSGRVTMTVEERSSPAEPSAPEHLTEPMVTRTSPNDSSVPVDFPETVSVDRFLAWPTAIRVRSIRHLVDWLAGPPAAEHRPTELPATTESVMSPYLALAGNKAMPTEYDRPDSTLLADTYLPPPLEEDGDNDVDIEYQPDTDGWFFDWVEEDSSNTPETMSSSNGRLGQVTPRLPPRSRSP